MYDVRYPRVLGQRRHTGVRRLPPAAQLLIAGHGADPARVGGQRGGGQLIGGGLRAGHADPAQERRHLLGGQRGHVDAGEERRGRRQRPQPEGIRPQPRGEHLLEFRRVQVLLGHPAQPGQQLLVAGRGRPGGRLGRYRGRLGRYRGRLRWPHG